MALAPDPATRLRLASAAADLRARLGPAGRGLRFAAPPALHLTLRFLGDVAEGRLPAVRAAVTAAAASTPALALTVGGAGAFPGAGRPRAVFLAIGGNLDGLAALRSRLDVGLAAAGFPQDRRSFHPHLTVARPAPRGRVADLAAGLAGAAPAPIAWAAQEVTLFESHLGAGGARYEPLLVSRLAGPGCG